MIDPEFIPPPDETRFRVWYLPDADAGWKYFGSFPTEPDARAAISPGVPLRVVRVTTTCEVAA